MKGEILAALYSYGSCRKAKELEIFELVVKILNADGEDLLLKLRAALQQLNPYPHYLQIAQKTGISDPFAMEVIRAYWTGNHLLEAFSSPEVPHHNFAILKDAEVFSAHYGWGVIIINLNLCRISFGKIKRKSASGDLVLKTNLFVYRNGKLSLGETQEIRVKKGLLAEARADDIVAFHWGEAREVITESQAEWLKKIDTALLDYLNQRGN